MSIELLQTMEWSRLCWDQSFEEVIDLDSVLPRVGNTYPAKFSRNEDFVKEGKAFLLWQPPHSELNGWFDKRPSEILNSYVIEGRLKRAKYDELTFDFDVLGRAKLVDLFPEVVESSRTPLSYIGQVDASPSLQWQEARGLIKSDIGKYLYLHGSECETSLDVILSFEGDRACLHYSATLYNPAQYHTVITKYYLSDEERIVLDRLVSKAGEIMDDSFRFLEIGKINGPSIGKL